MTNNKDIIDVDQRHTSRSISTRFHLLPLMPLAGVSDRNGNLAVGAIASFVDKIGSVVAHEMDVPLNVSVDISISYLSTAKLNDELEINGKLIGRKGGYRGTLIVLKKKATGETIAEGRHSMFQLTSKI